MNMTFMMIFYFYLFIEHTYYRSINVQGARIKKGKDAKSYLFWNAVVNFIISLGTPASDFLM